MEYRPVRVSDLIRDINGELYLPAIQREFVWGIDKVERLFDSIMGDFPIGSFLFWKLKQEHKDKWPIYEFIREFNDESPHNPPANLSGITNDIKLVLDGQQRITSLFVGLKGSYRHFYYRWRKTQLFLNLLKPPIQNEENPEELTYGFSFREYSTRDKDKEGQQLWYLVGRILDHEDAEDAKADVKAELSELTDGERDVANKLIGRLHSRIHTVLVGNYYEEHDQNPEKVLQIFVRANSAGQPLEYSDLLLATATAKWESRDARQEINEFTDAINQIGSGYKFGNDFVLKACLYLTEDLPIQYKVKNFTKPNLDKIEANWDTIKDALTTTVRLMSRYGFSAKNIVAPLGVLPVALFLMRRGNLKFDTSSSQDDAIAQAEIRRWFIFATLKNAFGGSSDSTLTRLREILAKCETTTPFPGADLCTSLEIEPHFSDTEIDRILSYQYQGRYTYLVLSLLYPDRDWKNAVFQEDHIFPQSEFQVRKLRKRGYEEEKVQAYMARFNTLCNLELLTDTENMLKNATPFEKWLSTRDADFRSRHVIPDVPLYGFDGFINFTSARTELIAKALKNL